MFKRYDFKCTSCSNIEEQWVESLEETAECSKCWGTSQRIISPIRTQFKGNGWPDADDKWAKDHERAAKKSRP
jgi:putative FmdB family regulatory protein